MHDFILLFEKTFSAGIINSYPHFPYEEAKQQRG